MSFPLVSVVIPTFGRSSFLSNAIESVINQTYKNIELIIVDDNGINTDNQLITFQIVKRYGDRIKYIINEKNSNGSYSRNKGVEVSTGKYVCFLDDDDEFLENKILEQMGLMESMNIDACIVSHKKTNNELSYETIFNDKLLDFYDDILMYNIDACSGSTLMINRDVFLSVGGFDENLNRLQDYNFLVRLCFEFKVFASSKILCKINIHSGSYKPKELGLIERYTLDYLNSINYILRFLSNKRRNIVKKRNYYVLLKKSIVKFNLIVFVKYLLKIRNPFLILTWYLKDKKMRRSR